MPESNANTRLLLSTDDNSSVSSDDEDEFYNQLPASKNTRLLLAEAQIISTKPHKNARHQIHRKARRLTRFLAYSIGLLLLLLLIYIPIYNSVQSRLVSLPGWGYNTSRNTADYVMPLDDTTLIEPRNICTSNFFLLIVVCSAINNFAARQNIRETWGNSTEFNYPMFANLHAHLHGQYLDISHISLDSYLDYLNLLHTVNVSSDISKQNLPVRVVFLIGRSEYERHLGNETLARLKLEADQYDDLIQENFLDTYNNLTIKSVMMLKWVSQRCPGRVKFVMKCDDDTFVNVPNLLHYLLGGTIPVYNATLEYHDDKSFKVLSPTNRMTLSTSLLTGYLFCWVKPVANVSSKWYAPFYMFPGDMYPNYLSGASYLMSADVVPQLYYASLNASLLHLEDVYITGICSEKIHLRRRHNPLFCFDHSKNNCSFKGAITQHYVKGDAMKDVYRFVVNTDIKCPPPEKYFKTKRLRKRLANCT